MPGKTFIIRLSSTAFIFVYFATERGNVENDQALNVAIQDFKNNWEVYIGRWNKWCEEKK
jgi:hypothetical protein